MSDSNNGLQPVGGLAPIGGLAPLGGGAGIPPPPTPSPNPTGGQVGAASVGAINPPPPGATTTPTLRPPMPARPTVAPTGAPSVSSSVYVPPRGVDAEVWKEPGFAMGKVWACVGGAVAVGLLIAAFFTFRAPAPATLPTGYAPFVSGDKLWGFDAPQGWSQTTTGATSGDDRSYGFNGTVCRSGGAKIDITISTVTGLIKSQLLFGNDITPEAMGGSHANGIQKATLKPFKKTLRDYKETEITENLPSQMGQETIPGISVPGFSIPDMKTPPDVRMAEFTASGNSWGLGGPVHGYRATLGGKNQIAYIVCQCSENDWPRLQPEFRRMLDSVHETPLGEKSSGDHPSLLSPIGGL